MNALDRGLQQLLALARRAPSPEVEAAPPGFARRVAARWEADAEACLPLVWRGPFWTACCVSGAVILVSAVGLWFEVRPGEAALVPTTAYQLIASHLIP
jgi:hypothetical protein